MLRNGVGPFAGKPDERIGRCQVDDDTTPNDTCAVPATPGLGLLLAHRRHLCPHADQVAAGIDVHDAIEVVDVRLSDGCVDAVVNLCGGTEGRIRFARVRPKMREISLTPAEFTA